MISEEIIKDLDIDLIRMKSPSIAYVGYSEDYNILGIIYENRFNKIMLFENFPIKEFYNIIKEKEKCGVYVTLKILPNYEHIEIPRRNIIRQLYTI